jgi:hypothetical protein
MSLALCRALSALSFWKPPIARTFSSSLVRFADSGDTKPTEELSIADKEAEARARKAAYYEARKQRLREDPEEWEKFKNAESIANKKHYQRIKDDPEKYGKLQTRQRERSANVYEDLSWRDRRATSNRHWNRRKREQDPDYVKRLREESLKFTREKGSTLTFQLKRRLFTWTKHPWVCQLPWKTHTPMSSKDKIRRVCAACGAFRIDGTKYVS